MSYPRLKALKHLVSINLSCSEFSFMNILIDNLLMQFFIFKTVRCVRVKRFYSSWRFYGHGSRYVLVLSSRLEVTSWTKNRQICLENYQLQKNPNLHFKENCTKIGDISLIFIHFFFSQTNLFLKFNLVFIDMLDSFHYNSFIPFHYWYTDLKPLLRHCEVRV